MGMLAAWAKKTLFSCGMALRRRGSITPKAPHLNQGEAGARFEIEHQLRQWPAGESAVGGRPRIDEAPDCSPA